MGHFLSGADVDWILLTGVIDMSGETTWRRRRRSARVWIISSSSR